MKPWNHTLGEEEYEELLIDNVYALFNQSTFCRDPYGELHPVETMPFQELRDTVAYLDEKAHTYGWGIRQVLQDELDTRDEELSDDERVVLMAEVAAIDRSPAEYLQSTLLYSQLRKELRARIEDPDIIARLRTEEERQTYYKLAGVWEGRLEDAAAVSREPVQRADGS